MLGSAPRNASSAAWAPARGGRGPPRLVPETAGCTRPPLCPRPGAICGTSTSTGHRTSSPPPRCSAGTTRPATIGPRGRASSSASTLPTSPPPARPTPHAPIRPPPPPPASPSRPSPPPPPPSPPPPPAAPTPPLPSQVRRARRLLPAARRLQHAPRGGGRGGLRAQPRAQRGRGARDRLRARARERSRHAVAARAAQVRRRAAGAHAVAGPLVEHRPPAPWDERAPPAGLGHLQAQAAPPRSVAGRSGLEARRRPQ